MNIESTLEAALDAALEAHTSGYAHGMGGVIRGIEAALNALDDVVWGDTSEAVNVTFDEVEV